MVAPTKIHAGVVGLMYLPVTITFEDDGTTDGIVGNWNFIVKNGDEVLHTGKIEGHNMLMGWRALVSCLAREVWGDDPNQMKDLEDGT